MGTELVFSFLVFVETSLIRFFLGQDTIGTAEFGNHQSISFSGLALLSKVGILLLVMGTSLIAISFPWLTGCMLREIRIVSGLMGTWGIAFGHDGSAISLAD
jgi:hypothetical protein